MAETGTGCTSRAHRLLQLGVTLFLLGLLTGLVVPLMANPRMGLSSHLEGIMNGLLLIALGLLWPKLRLGERAQKTAFVLAVYGTFVNWATTLVAAGWGAGGPMMPLAAKGYKGSGIQEGLIGFGLISLSAAMIVVCGMVLYGLRRGPGSGSDG